MSAFVDRGDRECAPRAGGSFFEYERDIPPVQQRMPAAHSLFRLEVRGQVEQKLDFPRKKIP
jgi:hypothetical protein